MPQHTANRVAIFAFTCERSVKARGKPPRRKGHGEGRGFFATESEGQAATPQGARDGGKKGKRRPCGLARKFGPHNCHLPTYRPSHPSHLLTSLLLPDVSPYLLFLLLPLVLQLRASARHCLVVFLPSRAAAQQDVGRRARRSSFSESKRPEPDPAVIDGGPDAATRKSVRTLGWCDQGYEKMPRGASLT